VTVAHLLNRTLTVWREVVTDDGSGGQDVTRSNVGTVSAKVDQPTAKERDEAQQWGAEHSHSIFMLVDADVHRGDELRGGGQVFRVLATVKPSSNTYLKAPASELIQPETTTTES
jgi:head-tail adaptor